MQQLRGQSPTATSLFFSPLLARLHTPFRGEPWGLLLQRGLGQAGVEGLGVRSALVHGGERTGREASRSLSSGSFSLL